MFEDNFAPIDTPLCSNTGSYTGPKVGFNLGSNVGEDIGLDHGTDVGNDTNVVPAVGPNVLDVVPELGTDVDVVPDLGTDVDVVPDLGADVGLFESDAPSFGDAVPVSTVADTDEISFIPINTTRRRTNKHKTRNRVSSQPTIAVAPHFPPLTKDVILKRAVTIPLIDERHQLSTANLNSAQRDVLTDDIYFDSL